MQRKSGGIGNKISQIQPDIPVKGLDNKSALCYNPPMNTKLNYDPVTGIFTWAISRPKCKAGAVAGSAHPDGYLSITIDGKKLQAHRIAWFFHHGNWPADQIDHINGIRTDNRISNLREATDAENQQNRGKNKNNTSGYTGVHWNKTAGKFVSQISVNGKILHLGLFDDPKQARQAYLDAKVKYHGFNPISR